MNRPGKRPRRGSTADRASVDTNASFASSASSNQGQAKRLKKEDGSLETSGSLAGTSKDSQPPSPNSMDLVEELFTAVIQHVDEKGRQLSAEFSLLPPRKNNEDYYSTVKKPIDLKQIAMRIQRGGYNNLDALVSDLLLMTDNALDYNASSSQLHKDAALMKKFVLTKRNEYEQRELHRTAERTVRTRRSVAQTTQPLSAVYAALEYGDEESAAANVSASAVGEDEVAMEADSDEESHDTAPSVSGKHDRDDEKTTAMYQLLDGVLKLKGPAGRIMSGPFMKLPSKRKYKDYYDIIRNPVSITNIRTKIKNGLYLALDEMILDLRLMCQNAQKFNEGTSGIYRDSVRIEKFVEGKHAEYIEALDKVSSPFRTSLSERLLPEYDDYAARRRAKYIVRSILECKKAQGYPAEMFLEKPSKKEYKDYYSIIPNPIDLKIIVNKVIGDKYANEEALMEDIQLMCSNAKVYNREDSDIHGDALLFEELVKKAQRTMNLFCPLEGDISPAHSPIRRSTSTTRRTQAFRPPTTPLQAALMALYEYVVNYSSGDRYLSTFFQTLPAKSEMPSYYEVIKKPIDLDKIQQRIQNEQYANFEEAIDDFGQMFENAAAFNEPTSDIYKDALVLLHVMMEKAQQLGAFAGVVPDVQQKVQEMLHALMDSMLTLEKEGRNLSQTIADCTFSESDSDSEASGHTNSCPPLTLETIKANVDGGRYRRMDRFQDDMFELLEKARFTAQPDSATYEDAVHLHVRFIEKRDELCGPSGEKLFTPALQFTVRHFQSSIDMERKEAKCRPLTRPSPDQAPRALPAALAAAPCVMGANNEAFSVGDFVYLAPDSADGKQPMIVCVQEIVKGEGGALQVRGCYMLRPQATAHQAGRRFYEKEVLQSDWVDSHAPTRIIGRCYVLEGKDYFQMVPLGLADGGDVYVCDHSYNVKEATFKKIKKWTLPASPGLQLVKRQSPLPAVRAILAEGQPNQPPLDMADVEDKPSTSSFPLSANDQVIDVVRETVLARSWLPQEGQVFYEQKALPKGHIKLGDCFAVMKDDKEAHLIKIDKIFDKEEVTFVSGTVFLLTKDIPAHLQLPAKLFYHNEVFQKVTEIEEAWPVTALGPRCAVLTCRDFATCRPTEIAEERIYIVESKILDNGMLAKGNKSKRLLNVSNTALSHATSDEILFFDKNINPHKVLSPTLQAALSGQIVEVDRTPEESPAMGYELDEEETHSMIASEITDQTPLSPTASTIDLGAAPKKRRRGGASTPDAATPSGKRSPAKKTKYTVSGFILYGAENRKSVKDQFPNLSFQDTSRHVSDMWKNLPASERKRWEDIARQKCNFVNTELKSRGLATGMTFKGLGSMDESAIIAEMEKRLQQQDSLNKANAELAKAAKEGPLPTTAPTSTTSSSSLPSTSTASSAQPGGVPSAYNINAQTIALLQAQQQHFQRQLQLQQQQFQQERQSQQAQQRSLFLTLPTEAPKVKKAIHTSVFLKYLEENGMLGSGQKPAVAAWRRQMAATQHNTPPPQQLPDFWPTLLNIDAQSKNKAMETLGRMWSSRNFILTKTCALQPAALMANSPFTGDAPTTAMTSSCQQGSATQPPLVPSPPPILSRSNSARKSTTSRR